jgi:AcrR family transcriptional regulator
VAVRDIARAAGVADGVLYNYFEDKEDLLAHALLAHVARVMGEAPPLLPEPGTGTVAANLASFIETGMAVLMRVMPAFAGLVRQPNVLTRFRAMVGGNAAFGSAATAAGDPPGPGDSSGPGDPPGAGAAEPPGGESAGEAGQEDREPRGLPDVLTAYLHAEQALGRVDPAADVASATMLIVGAMHGQVLPPLLFNPAGGPFAVPPGLPGDLAATVLSGIAPQSGPGAAAGG